MKIGRVYFGAAFLCLFFGQILICAQEKKTEKPVGGEMQASIETEENLIHLGDVLNVDIVGSSEFDWRGTLTPEGDLNGINYTEGSIKALCRSESEVAADVARAFSKVLRDPKVEVKIIDRSKRPVSVLYGAVKIPQRFQIKRPVSLNELLIVAGGLTDKASGEIQISRPKNLNCATRKAEPKSAVENISPREKAAGVEQNKDSQYITVKVSDLIAGKKEANPQIFGGDIITVAEADSIYVVGGVANPKQIYLRSQTTLSRAIDSAGGMSRDADVHKITVFRRESGERKIIESDFEKIKKNQADDLILRPFDVVDVAVKGRRKDQIPPDVKNADRNEKNTSSLPLRVID